MYSERRNSKSGCIDIPASKRATFTDRSAQRSIVREKTIRASSTLPDGDEQRHVQCSITNNKDALQDDNGHESAESSIFEFDGEEDGSWGVYSGSSLSSECAQSKRLEWLARVSLSESSSNSQSLTSSKDSADGDITCTTETEQVPIVAHDGLGCVSTSRSSSNADVRSCDSHSSSNGSPPNMNLSWTNAGHVQHPTNQSNAKIRSRSSSCTTWDSQVFSPPMIDIVEVEVNSLILSDSLHPQRITILANQFVVSAFEALAAHFPPQQPIVSHQSRNLLPEVILVDDKGVERAAIAFQVFINRFFEGICATSSASALITCRSQVELETLLSCLLVVDSTDGDGHASLGYPAASRLYDRGALSHYHTVGQLLRLCHDHTDIHVPVTFGKELLQHLCDANMSKDDGALRVNQRGGTESQPKRCKAMDLAHESLLAGFKRHQAASDLEWIQLHKSFAEPLTADACRTYIKRPSIGTRQSPGSTDGNESQQILGIFDLYIDRLVDSEDQGGEYLASPVIHREGENRVETKTEAVPRVAMANSQSPSQETPNSSSSPQEYATAGEFQNIPSRFSGLFDSICRRLKAPTHNNASIIDSGMKKPLSPSRSRATTMPSACVKASTTTPTTTRNNSRNVRNATDVSSDCPSLAAPRSRTAMVASKSRVDFLEDLLQTRILGNINRKLLDRQEAIAVSVSKSHQMRDVRVIFDPASPPSIDKRPRRMSEVHSERSFFDHKQGSTTTENCNNKVLPQLILPQAKSYDELLIALLLHFKTEQKHLIHNCPSSALDKYRLRKGFHLTPTLQ